MSSRHEDPERSSIATKERTSSVVESDAYRRGHRESSEVRSTSVASNRFYAPTRASTIMSDSMEWESEDIAAAVYDQADFISGPVLSEGSSVPTNILEFHYSFGFDCQQHSNLCVLDANTLAFMSGNLLHFFQVAEQKLWFRRSAGGGGLGHIAKNPVHPHLAVGEMGQRPYITVFEWPSMNIVALLKRGAREKYTHLSYSQDGELLCSVGGPPEHYLTVWNWRESRIMLRAKSSSQDVFQAAFSSYMPGHITSSGSAHVRFWRMAHTFTGLKLMGVQGRFGNTEVSDVIGVLAMPDGKVVSGCEWGNILLWQAGLIKVEVTKKGRKSCHTSPITQFEYCNGELVTLGLDGFVKVWYFETIDLADPPDDDRYVEVEPIFELEVADELGTAALMSMRRRNPREGGDGGDNDWVVQDANGGLWLLDLSLSAEAPAPRRLFTAHACGVAGMACSQQDLFVATLGREGRLHVYCHREQRRGLVIAKSFPAAGNALLWLPIKVAPGGCVLVLAFGDGVLRVVAVDLAGAAARLSEHGGTGLGTAAHIALLQTAKAHGEAATALALSEDGSMLASGGADHRVFLFATQTRGMFASLSPIGFVEVPDEVTCLTFKPSESHTLLTGCARGQVTEIRVPQNPQHDVNVSLKYTEATLRTFTYKSVKSQIRREQQLQQQQRRKAEALQRRQEQLLALREKNPTMEIDEEVFFEDEPEEAPEPLHAPAELGAVRWLRYLGDDAVWLSVTGYDCGYLYEYELGGEDPYPEPRRSTPGPGGDDCDICSLLYYPDNQYVFVGMGDGVIRVARVKPDPSDLSDNWSLGMHNPTSGAVTLLCLSSDGRTLFSAAPDGNVFMYAVHPEGGDPPPSSATFPAVTLPVSSEEVYGADMPTLEEQRSKSQHDRTVRAAAERKQHMEQILWTLAETYNTIIRRNRALPASQVIPPSELELDPRIGLSTQQALEAEVDLLKRKLAYPEERACMQYHKLASFYTHAVIGHGVRVPGLRRNVFVETIRQRKLTAEFEAARALVESKLEEAEQRGRVMESQLTLEEVEEDVALAPAPVESFLRGISAFESKFNARLKRLLEKYHSRKYKRERRLAEWAQFMKKKPDLNKNDPEDEATIREAVQTIGDYRLKSDPDYRVPPHLNTTTAKKYLELLQVRQQLDDLLTSFNSEVLALREQKSSLADSMAVQAEHLHRVHRELPPGLRLQPPSPPTIDVEVEYPERKYQITEEDIEAEMEKASPARRPVAKAPKMSQDMASPEDIELEALLGGQDSILEMEESDSWEGLVESLLGSEELRPDGSEVDIDTLMATAKDDSVNTSWENERRAARLIQQVWRQQRLVAEMNQQVDALDQAIEDLAARRLLVQRDAALLRHRLLVLHQELIIIKACEGKENRLAARVAVKTRELVGVQNQLTAIQVKLDLKSREILRCQEKEKEIQVTFLEAIADYQFIEYLRKVFKKKYRPAKASSAGSTESSSSESSEDDEDEDENVSLESNEAGPLRFDDTTCPPGCSQDLFDLTIKLRSQRHETERDVVELRRQVEQLRREQEEANKRMKKAEEELCSNQEVLEAFQREKQQRLNEVETVVILKLNQLQHVRPDGKFEQLRNTLVFNTAVLTDLDRRKQQLDDEARAQRAKHKKNRTHLHRMMVDVAYMRDRLRTLRNHIEDAQFRKFGCVVDVMEVEQALLKRFIWDLRSSADEIRAEFQGLIFSIQLDVRKKFDELKRAIEQNTERQNLLVVLLDERNRLLKAVNRKQRLKGMERPSEVDQDDEDEDVSRLQEVLKQLTARHNALLGTAVRLRQKGALPPISRPRSGASSTSGSWHTTAKPSSHYHNTCGAERIPPPPRPWPPTCVTALKHPMYLGRPRRSLGSAPPGTPTTVRSTMADRRAAVRQQLESGEQASVLHPHPTAGRAHSLDSITQGLPGFIGADLRDIPSLPSEEVLIVTPPPEPDPETLQETGEVGDEEPDDEEDAEEEEGVEHLRLSESSVEELFRRVPSDMAQTPVEQFLERLGAQDGEEVLMQFERRLSRAEGDSSPPTSDDEEPPDGLVTSDLDDEDVEQAGAPPDNPSTGNT